MKGRRTFHWKKKETKPPPLLKERVGKGVGKSPPDTKSVLRTENPGGQEKEVLGIHDFRVPLL